MHKEILANEQKNVLPLLTVFSQSFGLVGGTAMALIVGHRTSVDFDLATIAQLKHNEIRDTIKTKGYRIESTLVDETDELTLVIQGVSLRHRRGGAASYGISGRNPVPSRHGGTGTGVKITFLKYPYPITFSENFDHRIDLPDIRSLAAMKAFALGRRAKWKDYVDLYFFFLTHTLKELVDKAGEIFGGEFNEKLFREQLAYFKDVDHSEAVHYMPGYETEIRVIEGRLKEISLQKG